MNRHSIRTAAAAVLLAGAAALGTLTTAGAAQAVTPADHGWGNQNINVGSGIQNSNVGSWNQGSNVGSFHQNTNVTPANYVWGNHNYGWANHNYGYGYGVEGGVVSPIPLNIRSGPGTGYPVVGALANGTTISISGKTNGTNIFGNRIWYRLADGQGWVSARYVNNYGYVPWITY